MAHASLWTRSEQLALVVSLQGEEFVSGYDVGGIVTLAAALCVACVVCGKDQSWIRTMHSCTAEMVVSRAGIFSNHGQEAASG